MINKLKICVVFNSGACGDFLTQMLMQLEQQSDKLIVDSNGAVTNTTSEKFKEACKLFYENNFDPKYFNEVSDIVVGNTHYCYQELLNVFPDCDFYYIDDSKFVDITTAFYIKKRIMLSGSMIDYLQQNINFRHVQLTDKNLSDTQIQKIMKRDWKRHLEGWKGLNITAIPLDCIVDKIKCRQIVKTIIKSLFNEEIFNKIFDTWAEKNSDLINCVLGKNV
jgi:hypothetical protein